MKTIQLHGTDLMVSQPRMGTANFGTPLDQQQINAPMDRLMALGGNFVDTSYVYSDWVPGEKAAPKRCLAIGSASPTGTIWCFARRADMQLTIDLNESLAYLQMDCIDPYMHHRNNPALPVSEIMDCLDGFVRAGKVRYLAGSNWNAQRSAQANEYAKAHGKAPFGVNELTAMRFRFSMSSWMRN